MGGRPPGRRVGPWVAAGVALAAFGAFLPVLGNGFVDQWDDQTNFLLNHAFRGLGWPNLRWALTTTLQGAYQPLAWVLFEAEYAAWGLDPRGYHLASLVLHAADAALFYALTRAVLARAVPGCEPRSRLAVPLASGLAAAVFAAHPLRVEVVAWVSCQPYLPCAGLAVLSVLAYLRSCDGGPVKPGWRLASLALYAAALGCKAVPVGLPVVLLVLDRSVLDRAGAGRPLRGLLFEKVPYLLPAVVASWMAVEAKSSEARGGPPGRPAWTLARRAATAGYGLSYYLERTAWPGGLSAYHFRPDPVEPAAPPFAGRLAAVAALGVAALLLRRRWPAVPAALAAYAALLAPNLGVVPHGLMLVADRYAYVATMPLFVVAAGVLARCVAASRRPAAAGAAAAVAGLGLVAVLGGMSWSLCRTWRDSQALWSHALDVGSGRDALLESNLGVELYEAGRVREGLAHLRKAVAINPADAGARENLGVALLKQGDEGRGVEQLAEAVRLAGGRSDFRHQLGLALARRGRLVEAAGQLREAARLRPDHPDAHASLGQVLVDLGRREDAIAEFTRALVLAPGHRGAWAGLERLRDRGRPAP